MRNLLISIYLICITTILTASEEPWPQSPVPGGVKASVPNPEVGRGPIQQTGFTCWAASTSNLLRFYGVKWSEASIVQQIKPGISGQALLGNPTDFATLFNNSYVDDNGKKFTLSARATDNYTNTVHDVSNQDMEAALAAGQPIFYADKTHAMVMVAGFFFPSPMGLQAGNIGTVIDPEPMPVPFDHRSIIRPLGPGELQGKYIAIVTVTTP